MEVAEKQDDNSRKLPQYFAGIVAAINTVSAGCVFGWTSPALPLLHGSLLVQHNTSVPAGQPQEEEEVITPEEGSLIGSLIAVGALVGSMPAGHLANLLGRRRLIQVVSLLLVVGWGVIVLCGRQVVYLCVARFLLGICIGIGSVVTPLYNEEISEVTVRGSLGLLYDAALNLGILWVYLAGAVMPYLWMNLTSALPALASFVLLFFVPESPVHILVRGDDQKAKEALSWLRGRDYDVEPEIASMRRLVEKARETSTAETLRSARNLTWRSLRSPTAKSLFIVAGLMSMRQLSGITVVTFYAEDIIAGSGAAMEASMAATVVGLFEVLVTLLMVFVGDMAGRRVLLMASCFGSALTLVGLALGPPGWLPVVSVVVYITMFTVGFGCVPWFMMAELVPTEAKGWVTGCVMTLNWFFMFLVTHFFVTLVVAIGTSNTYLSYAVVNALAGVGVLLFVPETKGKTLEMIQKELGGK